MLSYFVFRTLDSSVFDTKTCPCWDSWVLATTHPVFFPPPLWLSLRGVLGTHVDTPACMSRFWPHPSSHPQSFLRFLWGRCIPGPTSVLGKAGLMDRPWKWTWDCVSREFLQPGGSSGRWGGGPWALGLEKAQLEDRMRSGAGPSCWGSCMFPPLGTYGVLF